MKTYGRIYQSNSNINLNQLSIEYNSNVSINIQETANDLQQPLTR